MTYDVRLATADDVPMLADVESRADTCFVGMKLRLPTDLGTVPTETLEAAQADNRLWVADTDDEIVGFALVIPLGAEVHLEQLSVVPEHQKRGLGSRLLNAAIDFAESRDFPALTLCTFAGVPWNQPFYETKGFVVLDNDQLTPELQRLRHAESEIGLDLAERVVMRKPI